VLYNSRTRSARPIASVAFGIRFQCIDLPTLIRIKEAAETQDQEAIAELRVLLEEIDKKQT
jgi:hypothetical protein